MDGGATAAEALLATLYDRGISTLFVNGGTDFAPIVEAYARVGDSGLRFPEPVVCAHENLAVSMAHGAYLSTGRPQALMLHTNVGTANAVCGLINAGRDRIPLFVSAGRTPLFEHSALGARSSTIHWGQEMYDQAGMVRELVKWDYELRDGAQVTDCVDRALGLATQQPRGPVYLTLPREVLAGPVSDAAPRPAVVSAPAPPHPDPSSVDRLADALAAARFPVFVVSATGLDRPCVRLLEDLADRHAIGVVEVKPRAYNIAPTHCMHLGYDGVAAFRAADVVCVLDVDVPWVMDAAGPVDEATVVHCGPEPSFGQYPMRSHRSDLGITTEIRPLLELLGTALEARRTSGPARRRRIEDVGRAVRAGRETRARAAAGTSPRITKAFMNQALASVLPADATVVNEYWARPESLPLAGPGSYFGTPVAGGLGWALPAAMGIKLTDPERTVVATVGDGAYLFANPAACHDAMAMHDLPVLTIVCSNRKWGAVELSTTSMYPHGSAASAPDVTPLARLGGATAFDAYARASGGYGERVSECEQLVPALRRALHATRDERRQALVDVACE